MSDLVAFLQARLDEREERMEHIRAYEARTSVQWMVEIRTQVDDSTETVRRIRAVDPVEELVDIVAKRAIIAHHMASTFTDVSLGIRDWTVCVVCHFVLTEPDDWDDTKDWPYPFVQYPFPCPTLRQLAQAYRTHPDFDPEWDL